MTGLLLSAAIALLWWQHTHFADPVVTICRCGDLIRHAPCWPARCPSCGEILF